MSTKAVVTDSGSPNRSIQTICRGFGGDLVDGGPGKDVVDFYGSLATTHSNLEDIWGTQFADMLRGDSASNYISGGPGEDDLRGEGGDDHLVGAQDADAIDGGPGQDVCGNNPEDSRSNCEDSNPLRNRSSFFRGVRVPKTVSRGAQNARAAGPSRRPLTRGLRPSLSPRSCSPSRVARPDSARSSTRTRPCPR